MVKKLTLEEVSKAINGKLSNSKFNDIQISNVSTDTREDLENKLFTPLKGDNFDGHNYIKLAFEKKAICVLTEIDLDITKPFIKVESTKSAFRDLAEYYKSLFNIKVVAITGSSGKTTTKDITASVLEQKYKVFKTKGNFNNEIGVPKMIFSLEEDTEVAVLELGMNSFGEIHNLSKIVRPDFCIITNIGSSHIEHLGSKNGILKAKSEIFDYMTNTSIKVLNGDDDLLNTIQKENIIFYGLNKSNNVYAENIIENGIESQSFDIVFSKDDYLSINLSKSGSHMISNSLSAATIGKQLGLTNEEIKLGLESFELTQMRMEIIKNKSLTILNDVYNANPESMKASIDVLTKASTKKVCILGDMLELGDFSDKLHFELGEYVFSKNIDILVCVGKKAYNIYLGAKGKNRNLKLYYFENKESLFIELNNILNKSETILVKASRGMAFEKITTELINYEVNNERKFDS